MFKVLKSKLFKFSDSELVEIRKLDMKVGFYDAIFLFENLEYKTTPSKWNKGKRAHTQKCIQYTQNHVAELFARENCILLSPYKNIKSILTYKFNDSTYSVRFDNWLYLNSRPHKN